MRVTIGTLEVEVVSQEQAERAAIYVCVPWSGTAYFPDDVRATCAGCGGAIRHRPNAPRRPMKLCLTCAAGWVNQQ
jgi:hypothetical protein